MTMNLVIILVAAIILFGLIYFVSRKTDRLDRAFFESRWDEIQKLYQSSDKNWPQAIMEGDKLLDEALKRRGFKGKNMGERMVAANRTFKDPDSVWKAHKIRNKVVHEVKFEVKKQHASIAIRGFRKGLKDLDVI